MRKLTTDDVEPVASRIYHPSGQYFPRPTVTPQESAADPPSTTFVVANLQPFTVHDFQVLSENALGKAASVWTSGRTLEAGNTTGDVCHDVWLLNNWLPR